MNYNTQDKVVLLDFYAAAALAGQMADPNVRCSDAREAGGWRAAIAESCFDFAEAMIAERQKRLEKKE